MPCLGFCQARSEESFLKTQDNLARRTHNLIGLQFRAMPLIVWFESGSALPPTQGLPGPSGPEPRKSPKRVQKKYPGPGPQKFRKSAPPPESQKSPKRVEKSGFRLFSDSFETPGRTLSGTFGHLAWGTLSGLFSDSSGVLGPKGPGDPALIFFSLPFWISLPFSISRNSLRF